MINVKLKSLCLLILMFGCLTETYALGYERVHLNNLANGDPKRTDLRSIQYNSSLLDYRFIYITLKYLLPFLTVFLFKPISKIFNSNLKFGIFAFLILRVIPELCSEYYKTFFVEANFKFNVLTRSEFFIDYISIFIVDGVITVIIIQVSTLFTEISAGRRSNSRFFSDSPNETNETNINFSGPAELDDVNLASEGATISYSDCTGEKIYYPITLFVLLIACHILRATFFSEWNNSYRCIVNYSQTPFNQSIHFLSANNIELFKKRVKYSVSKSTLHSEIKIAGVLHPDAIISVNNFYYTTPVESLYLGPIVQSMVESYDNLIMFFVDVCRYISFCIIVFGVIRMGFEEFLYKSTPVHCVMLFISYCLFLTVDTYFKIFSNSINRSLTLSHDCAAVTMGFQILVPFQKLYTADARDYIPSIPFKLLYDAAPALSDHVARVATCQ